MTILEAVDAEIALMPEAVRTSPPAAMCRALAMSMEDADNPRDVATVSRELRASLDALREAVARAGKRGDSVDEIGAKRAARRSAKAAAASSADGG